ncbi:xylulokinase [Marinilactibacillus kalidii]|uniref:xylulokinase n=1 Tax=Marinilactibacillus kalidii TaxID=2820274 RepID=UPI001ABE49C4|nr:FGGY-family carbohydrate kinase [Marinilactibacillus kalidii]
MSFKTNNKVIDQNTLSLGIEFGSTRVKAVLINDQFAPIASGAYDWENKLIDGYWTYDLDEVWSGLQIAYKELFENVRAEYDVKLTKVASIGFSGMMHGYLSFNKNAELLVPFRTWRNTTTDAASKKLTELFAFNIPHRWTISHLYQAILNKEAHVKEIDFVTTLAGYVHWKLTGERVVGVGEAAGMFPIDSEIIDFDKKRVAQFNELEEVKSFDWSITEIFPKVLAAGSVAGKLSEEGANLIDPTGHLMAGIPFCPPEGDAGTGMVATNSVAERTGNISAGTSVFSMIVLEEALSSYYEEIDMVTTPTGKPTAMVHCNNFTTDINAWAKLFGELIEALGLSVDKNQLFTTLFEQSLKADSDGGKLVSCNYYSGEPITGLEEGRPLFVQMPDSVLSLPNFMRTQIYSALATLKIGMDILTSKEDVRVDQLLGHGGFFKTKYVGQKMMADALNVPVTVMETAGEGGPWGMALLAAYLLRKQDGETLEAFLDKQVFSSEVPNTVEPSKVESNDFEEFMKRYTMMLDVEKQAVQSLK